VQCVVCMNYSSMIAAAAAQQTQQQCCTVALTAIFVDAGPLFCVHAACCSVCSIYMMTMCVHEMQVCDGVIYITHCSDERNATAVSRHPLGGAVARHVLLKTAATLKPQTQGKCSCECSV
jgi:hypothetical protein